MRYSSLAVAASFLAFGGVAQATEFVQNGNFTQLTNGLGQIDGSQTTAVDWTTPAGGYNFVFNQADHSVNGQYGGLALWDAADGGSNSWNGLAPTGSTSNFLAMDGDFQTQAVSQTISGLAVGQTYTLSFYYAFGQQTGFYGDTLQHLSVSLGGNTQVFPSTDYALPSQGFSGWNYVSETITATSTSEVLSFMAYGNQQLPPFALVTDVSLTGGVPEPSTWALMLAGFAGLAFAGYRRSRSGSALAA